MRQQVGLCRIMFVATIITVCGGIGGCVHPSSTKDAKLITVSSPKIYQDDRVLRILDERKKALNEVVKTIQEKELQEISGVRQATKSTLSLRGQATDDAKVGVPDAIESQEIVPPATPSLSDKMGLPFQALLRKIAQRDQLITGMQLLYAGDIDVLDPDRQIILLRLDVSINDYIAGKSPWTRDTQFVTLGFKVETKEDTLSITEPSLPSGYKTGKTQPGNEMGAIPLSGPRVYALMPDYSSIVSLDSFVNSQLDRLVAQAAGKTGTTGLQGALDSQRALEESLVSAVEQPMQFAIYGAQENEFGFAFGPRRRIARRNWWDPSGWFGNRYKINYEIEPGPRDVYALVTLPCDAKIINISGRASTQPTSAKFHHVLDIGTESTSDETPFVPLSLKGSNPVTFHKMGCSKPEIVDTPDRKGLLVEPNEFYPKQSNALILTSNAPVSTESEIWINNVLLSREQISVIGRYRLKVLVPPNDSLKALLKDKGQTLTVRLLTPGYREGNGVSRFHKGIQLKDTDALEPTFDVDPPVSSPSSETVRKENFLAE